MTTLYIAALQFDPAIPEKAELLSEIQSYIWAKAQNRKITVAVAAATHSYQRCAASNQARFFLRIKLLEQLQHFYMQKELRSCVKIQRLSIIIARRELACIVIETALARACP